MQSLNQHAFIFISGALSNKSNDRNCRKTYALGNTIAHTHLCRRVTGCYNGIEEPSIMVQVDPTQEDEEIKKFLDLAKEYKQESILFVGADGYAKLVYTDDGRIEGLGVWSKISSRRLNSVQAYTIIGGAYYAAS